MRTFSPKAGDVQRQWHVIDASDVVLGRLASHAAILLRGKHKPIFAPHLDTGDFVIVVNAAKVALTGNKLENKRAYRHSGYPGGITSQTYSQLLAKHPERVVEKAVRGMLPKNSLGRNMLRKLKVYAGPDHPHQAQQPAPFEITQITQQATAAATKAPATKAPAAKASATGKKAPTSGAKAAGTSKTPATTKAPAASKTSAAGKAAATSEK